MLGVVIILASVYHNLNVCNERIIWLLIIRSRFKYLYKKLSIQIFYWKLSGNNIFWSIFPSICTYRWTLLFYFIIGLSLQAFLVTKTGCLLNLKAQKSVAIAEQCFGILGMKFKKKKRRPHPYGIPSFHLHPKEELLVFCVAGTF